MPCSVKSSAMASVTCSSAVSGWRMRSCWSWLSRKLTKKRPASPCVLSRLASCSLRSLEDVAQAADIGEPFGDRRQPEEQRKVERRVDAVAVARAAVAADELGDRRLVVIDLAEGEEVRLAERQRELAHGVAEDLDRLGIDVFRRVDAEAVEVVAGDEVLVRHDQHGEDRPHAIAIAQALLAGNACVVFDDELAHVAEIAAHEAVARPDRRSAFAPRRRKNRWFCRSAGQIASSGPTGGSSRFCHSAAPSPAPSRQRMSGSLPSGPSITRRVGEAADGLAVAHIVEDARGMVQHDVEDDADAARMRLVDQRRAARARPSAACRPRRSARRGSGNPAGHSRDSSSAPRAARS